MLELNDPSIRFALRAVTQAGELARQVQADLIPSTLTKEDRSPVTVADFAIQALIAGLLEEAFPGATLVAEETSHMLLQAEGEGLLEQISRYVGRFIHHAPVQQLYQWIDRGKGNPEGAYWVLDPIDGTKGFLRRGQYAIALAWIVEGQVQLGALGCPHLEHGKMENFHGAGSLAIAKRAQGAWVSPLPVSGNAKTFTPSVFQPLQVSSQSDPSQARLLRSYEAAHTNTQTIEVLAARLGIRTEPVRMDSQAKYVLLAAGSGEIMIRLPPVENPNYKEKIWDQAAGALILEEAGGRISDLTGKALDFTQGRTLAQNRGVLATNGVLHNMVLDCLESLLP